MGTSSWLAIIGGVSFLCYVTLYVIGFTIGFTRTFSMADGRARFVSLLMLQVIWVPIFSMMESVSVLYGLINRPKDLYVVKKEAESVFLTS